MKTIRTSPKATGRSIASEGCLAKAVAGIGEIPG
jgi:hypothetical protein